MVRKMTTKSKAIIRDECIHPKCTHWYVYGYIYMYIQRNLTKYHVYVYKYKAQFL